MAVGDWIILAMDAFDYITSNMEENAKPEEKTVPAQPIVVRQPIDDKIHRASKSGYIELADREGLSNTLYLDSGGVKTIGIGMTTSEIKDLATWPWNRRIETADCVHMFVEACHKYEDAINDALKVKVTQYEFDALLSITYNIGIAGMKNSTFIKRINYGDTKQNIAQAMSWWNKDNGKVVKGLINRRNAEMQLFQFGTYTNKGKIALITVDSMTHKPKYNSTIDIGQYL